jgi:hypothetical protein
LAVAILSFNQNIHFHWDNETKAITSRTNRVMDINVQGTNHDVTLHATARNTCMHQGRVNCESG